MSHQKDQIPPIQNHFYQNPQNIGQGLQTQTNADISSNQHQYHNVQKGQNQTNLVYGGFGTMKQQNENLQSYLPSNPPYDNNMKHFDSNPQNKVQGLPDDNQIPQPTMIQPMQLNQYAQINSDLQSQFAKQGQIYKSFPQKYGTFAGIYIVIFCGEIFIQRYLFGYVFTFSCYASSHIALLCLVIQIGIGKQKRQCCCQLKRSDFVLIAFVLLLAFFIAQVVGFVYAIRYPLRYQIDNVHANDAMAEYTDYYGSDNNQICENNGKCTDIPPVFTMSDTCRILQKIFGDNFKQKSYAQYCSQVLAGSEKDLDYDSFSSLQTGLIFYFAIGLLVSLIISVYLGKQLYNYRKAIDFQSKFKKAEKMLRNQYIQPNGPGNNI